jgi:hypothetical protein
VRINLYRIDDLSSLGVCGNPFMHAALQIAGLSILQGFALGQATLPATGSKLRMHGSAGDLNWLVLLKLRSTSRRTLRLPCRINNTNISSVRH